MEEGAQTTNNEYGKRPLWQWIILYLIIAAIVYGLIYYFVLAKKSTTNTQPVQQTNMQPTQQQATPTVQAQTSASPSAAKTITVEGAEFAFTPATITVKKGEAVTLTFKNAGKYPHNFTITALNVQTKTIKPGEEDTISFTPTKTGSFTYICTVPGHADKGMKGTLTVQ